MTSFIRGWKTLLRPAASVVNEPSSFGYSLDLWSTAYILNWEVLVAYFTALSHVRCRTRNRTCKWHM